MKLGYLTKFTPDEAARAQRLGFDCLEIHASSWAGNDVYVDKKQRQQILDELRQAREERGIAVSAVAHYHAGIVTQGKELIESMKKAIDLAAASGAGVLATIAWRADAQKSIADTIPAYKK
jgi:sugar phosphate isomerase/epimerase